MSGTARLTNRPQLEPHQIEYTSSMLSDLLKTLKRRGEARLLDLGPVCSENIRFFAQQVKKVSVCDIFLRLERDRRKRLAPGKVWRHLDYPPQSFDGIHIWDLCDHLEDQQVSDLAQLCFKMLRPRGMLMLIALDEQCAPSCICTFVVGKEYRLQLRPQPHLTLAWHFRHNRGLLSLLEPFKTAKTLRYRNGVREFIFVRD